MSEAAESDFIEDFAPIFDAGCTLLILGTMPSPASLRAGMYYSHPRNAFWRLLGDLTGDCPGGSNDEKRRFLLAHHIALWDTLKRCVRPGSMDADIRRAEPNDVVRLKAACPALRAVFLNGGAAFRYYRRYHRKAVGLPYFLLPSSSPANCRGGYPAKFEAWRSVVGPYLSGGPLT